MKPNPAARQIADFVARYTPDIADAITTCRRKLLARVPRGYELVYDNHNALAIGYAFADHASAAQVSIAGYSRWVTLFFLYGHALPDPEGLLQGTGSRVRSVRLARPDDLDRPAVSRLIDLALAAQADAFAMAPPLVTLIKSVATAPRDRRPR